MVMKRIATCPVDKLRMRVGSSLTIKAVRFPRVQQHVCDAGNGNIAVDRILPLWKFSCLKWQRTTSGKSVVVQTAVTEAHTLTG